MENIESLKKGTKLHLQDSDGLGTTPVKVVSVDLEEETVTVKYLDAVWDLNQNLLVHRKGATEELLWSYLLRIVK